MPKPHARRVRATDATEVWCAYSEEKFVVTGDGHFEGRALTFAEPDENFGYTFEPDAFDAALAEREVKGVKMFREHDVSRPIGAWLEIWRDEHCLYVKGKLTLETADAKEVKALMEDGALNCLSIGFHILAESDKHVLEADIVEISVVAFPADPSATLGKDGNEFSDTLRKYAANGQLPTRVRSVLPKEAQTLYRKAWNKFCATHPDAPHSRAHSVAWRAVTRKFSAPHKEAGMWVKKLKYDAGGNPYHVAQGEHGGEFTTGPYGPGAAGDTAEAIAESLQDFAEVSDEGKLQIVSYQDAGVMTRDSGFVVRSKDDTIYDSEHVNEIVREAAEERGYDTHDYKDVGILTNDTGFVARKAKKEFQVTVVKSARNEHQVTIVQTKFVGMRGGLDASSRQFTDSIVLDGMRRTADGYLAATARVARTGIQLYSGHDCGRPEMDVVRVYRPESEVFAPEAIKSFAHRPVTVDHPSEMVNADNWKDYAVGQTGDKVEFGNGFVRVPLVLMDAASIKAVEAGKRELSMGYTTDLKWKHGFTKDGQEYDAVQTDIRGNHLAIVARARGGSELRLGDRNGTEGDPEMPEIKTQTVELDGLPVEVTDGTAPYLKKFVAQMTEKLSKLAADMTAAEAKAEEDKKKYKEDADAALATKDAELETVKKQLEDAKLTPESLDKLVKDRADIISKAKVIIGDSLVTDGRDNADICKQVVAKRIGDIAKDWSEDQVAASFNTLAADKSKTKEFAAALADSSGKKDAREEAYDSYQTKLQNAWRNTPAA